MAMEISHPEGWPPTAIVAWMVGICTLYAIAWQLSCRKADPREPPVVAPTIPIPFIGHLLGMALQGGKYVKNLGFAPPFPNYTLLSNKAFVQINDKQIYIGSGTNPSPSSRCASSTSGSTS